MNSFADAISLRPGDEGRWTAHAHHDHESINAMFGGWTAAVALNAIVSTTDGTRSPSAVTVNYLGAVTPGDDVEITVEHLGGSRSIDHWRADLHSATDGHRVGAAMAVMTSRRDTDPHDQFTMPDVPEPETLAEFHAPGTQGQQTMIRPVKGEFGSGDTAGTHWLRVQSDRPLDHVQLVYLADQYAPRSFYWGEGPRPSATITMSVYFHAVPEELARVGTDYVLLDAVGTRGAHATSGQAARIWSRSGRLLATTEQLCWYR